MSAKDATMCAKGMTMCAKDATMTARDATMSAEQGRGQCGGNPKFLDHQRQGRD